MIALFHYSTQNDLSFERKTRLKSLIGHVTPLFHNSGGKLGGQNQYGKVIQRKTPVV